MAHAYTPGLKVTNSVRHRARRVLPIHGSVKAKVGDAVSARDVVAEAFMPGDVDAVNLANLLAMPARDVVECMLIKDGDAVHVGDVVARTNGIFGMFKKEYKSKYEGTIESVSEHTGQLIIRGAPIPVQMEAYLAGNVVEVIADEGVIIEAEVTYIQGIFGVGGEAHGPIRMATPDHVTPLSADMIKEEHKGAIVVGGARVNDEALERAREVGVAAVVAGGIDDQDLKDFLGYDLGVAITGTEDVGLTLIVTEGFGDIAMATRTYDLLQWREGAEAAVNGATQIRAGVMRPEIVIPIPADLEIPDTIEHHEAGLLEPGRAVRMIRDPYFGQIGAVHTLPSEPAVLGSGSKSRVLDVKLGDGALITVPRANVELIEG
ncbi:MAG: hypothetical protein AAF432_16530 [Planctomycetota bacterium]